VQKLSSVPLLKWYWFHLAAQIGFVVREYCVISDLDGWCVEVAMVHIATWLTIFLVSSEVWSFSKVRYGSETQKIAVDGLLDMLLLPVNISFFCAVCVRVLKLQPESQLRTIVSVVIESPDIYEAFALWSVLEFFVRVVQAETAKKDSEAMMSFRSFKSISLQGVKAWVWIQSAAVALKLCLQGAVSVYMPTLCFWASKSCASCSQWYDETISTASSAVTFILCSFAIMFVFYFEAGYRHYLRKTEPMWKFLGVKGIVSVTYFQWVVISLLARPFSWDDTHVYMFHCMLYAFWMPLLAVFHALLAYPYCSSPCSAEHGAAPWLTAWLQTLNTGEPAFGVDDAGENVRGNSDALGASIRDLDPHAVERGVATSTEVFAVQAPLATTRSCSPSRMLLYMAFCTLCCWASVSLILWAIPTDVGVADVPLRNITCTGEGDLAHFVQNRNDLRFALMNNTAEKWHTPGVAGFWLPLCASTPVGCQPGHYAEKGSPSVSCTAMGHYSWEGTCDAISCGAPPRLPHATPRIHDMERQSWTYGVTVHYDCEKPGFHGDLQAKCNVTGVWSVHGACEEVTCGSPPTDIPHAKPVVNPGRVGENVSTGMVVRYQCDAMYNGTPTATCGDDGMYVTEGRCRKECGAPPIVPHASPSFDNAKVVHGWTDGMRCPYVCDPGYNGFATALCGDNGNYTVFGRCEPRPCGPPPQLPHATPRMVDMARQHFIFGATVHYECDKPRFKGSFEAVCNVTGLWVVQGRCAEVMCGPPPHDVPHAKPVLEPSRMHGNISLGTVVRYQCERGYNGTPTAMCNDDGLYVTQGRCRQECGPPPQVMDASPIFDNAIVANGWIAGMGTRYTCDPGFAGAVTALCGEDGNYTVSGRCAQLPSAETDRLYRQIHGLSATVGIENSVLALGLIGLLCCRIRWTSPRTLPLLARDANQELVGGHAPHYVTGVEPDGDLRGSADGLNDGS